MNIYVGNIPYNTDENEISSLFEDYGEVLSVRLIKDRETDRFKGFGFVEMEQAGATEAINKLNNYEMEDRKLVVNEARERTERTSSSRRSY